MDGFILLADVPPKPEKNELLLYKQSGIDTYVFTEDYINYSVDDKQYLKSLELMDDLGLNVFIRGLGSVSENYYKKFDSIDFNDFKCVKGFYVTDEPSSHLFNNIYLNYVVWKNKKYPNLYWHLNLLPSYASEQQLGTTIKNGMSAYEHYINDYSERVLSQVTGDKNIGFDHYPLRLWNGKKAMTDNWLYDLCVVALKAKELGCNYSFCIQSFTDGDAWRVLTEKSEIEFQISTALAFGVTSFEFFLYNSLNFSEGNFIGMIKDGEKTDYFIWVKECIDFLRSFESVYFNYKWQGVNAVKGYKYNGNNLDKIEKFSTDLPQNTLAKSDSDAVIGIFEGKNDALLIANPNDPSEKRQCNIELSFNEIKNLVVINGSERKKLTCKEYSIKLDCGEMAFIEVKGVC